MIGLVYLLYYVENENAIRDGAKTTTVVIFSGELKTDFNLVSKPAAFLLKIRNPVQT